MTSATNGASLSNDGLPSNGTATSSSGSTPHLHVGMLRLLQICSPAFPIGAFAYSQGLEQAVERGWVNDARALGQWLCGVLRHGLARTDMPLLRRVYHHWSAAEPATEAGFDWSRRVLAYRETSELRAEEQLLGRSLARILSHLQIRDADPFVAHEDTTYLVMFALAAARFGISEDDMLGGFAFAWAENQVSAASRVMRLGQLAAQGVLSDFIAEVPGAVARSASVNTTSIGFSSPALFLASAWHEEQYSRLFRS